MNYSAFFKLLINNIGKLIVSLGITIPIYYYLSKQKGIYILSPFIYAIYSSITASTICIFLYLCNEIDLYLFIFYFLGEFFFFWAFSLKLPISRNINTITSEIIEIKDDDRSFLFFFIIFLIFILNKLILYKTTGIPIFLDSRNDVYSKGGGTGSFVRLDVMLNCVLVYYAAYFLFIKEKHKLFCYFVFFVYIITILLSASKSSFISLVFAVYSISLLYYKNNSNLLKKMKKNLPKIIFFMGFFLFIGFRIKDRNLSLRDTVIDFLFRLLVQGDAIFLGFPNYTFSQLHSDGFVSVFLGDFLSTFRIGSGALRPQSIGTQLFYLSTGLDYNSGSITPHQLLGIIEFGYFGGLLFSFFSGLLMNIMFSYYRVTNSHFINFCLLYFYTNAALLNYAYFSFNVSINNFLFCFIPIVFLYIIIIYITPRTKKSY